MRSPYALLLVCLVAPPLSSAFMVGITPSRPLPPFSAKSPPTQELRTPQANMVVAPLLKSALPLAPGLGLCAALAVVSERAAAATALSPLLWATIFGMIVRPSILLTAMLVRKVAGEGTMSALGPGVKFSKARLLRLGIVLYGAKLTLQQIVAVGIAGLLADLFTVASTLLIGIKIGVDVLKLERPVATLIAMGSAICGCSAVVATQPVVEGESHEVAAAVGTVVVCGTVAMFLYPFLYTNVGFLSADPRLMGIFTGATVHEIAGVVAAGNAMNAEVATGAIVTKLVRVALLAPTLVMLSTCFPSLRERSPLPPAAQESPTDAPGAAATAAAAAPSSPAKAASSGAASSGKPAVRAPFPTFVLGFALVTLLNSLVPFPRGVVKVATQASAFALAMAMAALGLDADVGKVMQLGPKPMVLAGILWVHLLVSGSAVARLLVSVFPG